MHIEMNDIYVPEYLYSGVGPSPCPSHAARWGLRPAQADIGRSGWRCWTTAGMSASFSIEPHLLNRYKTEEITAGIAEIEAADLRDPETKKQALPHIAKLTEIRDELSKQVRWPLPQWKVKSD